MPEDLFRLCVRKGWISVYDLLQFMQLNLAWYSYIRGRNELWLDLLSAYEQRGELTATFSERVLKQLRKEPYRRARGYHYAAMCREICHQLGHRLPLPMMHREQENWTICAYFGPNPNYTSTIPFFARRRRRRDRSDQPLFRVLTPSEAFAFAISELYLLRPQDSRANSYMRLQDVRRLYRMFGKLESQAHSAFKARIDSLPGKKLSELIRATTPVQVQELQDFTRDYYPVRDLSICVTQRNSRYNPNHMPVYRYLNRHCPTIQTIDEATRHLERLLNYRTTYVEAMDRFDTILAAQPPPLRLQRKRNPKLRLAQVQRRRQRLREKKAKR